MNIADYLCKGSMLVANPHFYDYIHHLELKEDGRVEMVDGRCQALRRRLDGRYEIDLLGTQEANVRFFDLRDVDPYERSPETKEIEPFTVRVLLETGPFAYECEVVWNVKPDEDPYVLFQARLAFDADPLAVGFPKWPEFPPEALEIPEFRNFVESHKRTAEASRRYYATRDREEMSIADLRKLDLPPNALHRLV